ncbi:hypothetical protein [Aeoliella mucimassa]|nr:hypothetical protein [Aeoliella mucimassa]
MAQRSDSFKWMSHLFSIVTIVLGVAVSWLIARDVAPPLNAITATFDRLAEGEACDQIPGHDRNDELGRLAAAAEVFRERAAETERLLEEVTFMKELERQHAHSSRLESIGQLAAGIAHEINTPMQCVANEVEFLEEQFVYLVDVVNQCQQIIEEDKSLSEADHL